MSSTSIQVATSASTVTAAAPQSLKRPADRIADRAAKRRSSRACLSCRSRKVRCDVVNGGTPCTNCRLDNVDCVLKESSRGRRPGTGRKSSRSANGTMNTIQLNGPPEMGSEDAAQGHELQRLQHTLQSPQQIQNQLQHQPTPQPTQQNTQQQDGQQQQQQQATPPHANHNQPPEYLVSLTFEDQQSTSPSGESADDNSSDEDLRDETDEAQDPGPFNADTGMDMNQGVTTSAIVDAVTPISQQGSHRSHPSEHSIPSQRSAPPVSRGMGSAQRRPSHHQRTYSMTAATIGQANRFSSADAVARRQSISRSNNGSNGYLPSYITPLPKHFSPRDIEYLYEKDALTIPDDELRDELVRIYVKIIYCFMPAVDLFELLAAVIPGAGENSHNTSRPVSLLLFQTIMFASVIFVDPEMLRARGFTSRKAARKIFFNRCRLLYGLDCEPDRLALIQSLLLMTYWYDSPEDEKDTWYWMGVTLSLSQVIGLHRDPESLHISAREKRLRRRIWWSVYIRDRLLALGIRRPARIRTDDFNVAMLSLDDFDTSTPSAATTAWLGPCGFTTREDDARRAMCCVCIELAKLCVCIGNILHTQYSVVTAQGISAELYKNIAVLPQDSSKQMAALTTCDDELSDWLRNQSPSAKYCPPAVAASRAPTRAPSPAPGMMPAPISVQPRGGNFGNDWAAKITWLHSALLHMIYYTTLGALHRPRALGPVAPAGAASSESVSTLQAAKEASIAKVKKAAVAITKLAFDLQSENYLRYLSTSSIPAFLSASLVHLLDSRMPDEEVRNLSIGRFYQCYHVLHGLQDMYASADYAIRFLESVLKRMAPHLPLLPRPPPVSWPLPSASNTGSGKPSSHAAGAAGAGPVGATAGADAGSGPNHVPTTSPYEEYNIMPSRNGTRNVLDDNSAAANGDLDPNLFVSPTAMPGLPHAGANHGDPNLVGDAELAMNGFHDHSGGQYHHYPPPHPHDQNAHHQMMDQQSMQPPNMNIDASSGAARLLAAAQHLNGATPLSAADPSQALLSSPQLDSWTVFEGLSPMNAASLDNYSSMLLTMPGDEAINGMTPWPAFV